MEQSNHTNTKNKSSTEYPQPQIIDYGAAVIENYSGVDPFNQTLDPKPNPRILFTCEHSRKELPEGYSWTESDLENFKDKHWAIDIGALDLARALAKHYKSSVVYSKYCRLLIDVNRAPGNESLFRAKGDGIRVDLNKGISLEEKKKRQEKYYLPYWHALRDLRNAFDHEFIFSFHSFTPIYKGKVREIEFGMLNTHFDQVSRWFQEELRARGKICFINKPYSPYISEGQASHTTVPPGEGLEDEFRQGGWRQGKHMILLETRNDLLQGDNFEGTFGLYKDIFNKLLSEGVQEVKFPEELPETYRVDEPRVLDYTNARIALYIKEELQKETRVGFYASTASSDLPDGLEWSDSDRGNIVERGLAHSVETGRLAEELAAEFGGYSFCPKYSHLLCDVRRIMSSSYTVPKEALYLEEKKRDEDSEDGFEIKRVPVELNQGLSNEDVIKREDLYYYSFYEAYAFLKNELQIKARYIINLATFKKVKLAKQPDIILNTNYSQFFALRFKERLEYETAEEGLEIVLNKGIHPKCKFDYSHHVAVSAIYPRLQEGVVIYIQEDLIKNRYAEVKKWLSATIQRLCYREYWLSKNCEKYWPGDE